MKPFIKFPIEVPKGKTIEWGGRILECKEATEEKSCNACYLLGTRLCRSLACMSHERKDKEEVYFERKEM